MCVFYKKSGGPIGLKGPIIMTHHLLTYKDNLNLSKYVIIAVQQGRPSFI